MKPEAEPYIWYGLYADYWQCFEIETGDKKPQNKIVAIDTGINNLITTSTYNHYGNDLKNLLLKIKGCKHGSNRQKSLRKGLRQRIDEVIKVFIKSENPDLIVFEDLSSITKDTRKRSNLNRKIRFFLGSWNVGYYFSRLKQQAETNTVSFRTVSGKYTSQKCSSCNHTEKRNRIAEMFKCLKCGYSRQADENAAYNILMRFFSGPYGAGCKENI